MLEQLKQLGIGDSRIALEPDIRSYTGTQYFDIWEPRQGEIFIDCGAYDGDTIRDFVEWTNHEYEGIYSFEPSDSNYARCKQYVEEKNIENCVLIKKGTWSETTTLKFSSYMFDTGDHVVTDASLGEDVVVVEATSIDEVLSGKKATFIKMDVEGSEMQSLKGARETIMNYAPRLAIAVYHKPEDLFDIPLYILSLNSNYRFKLRHYSSCSCETVLYAESDN